MKKTLGVAERTRGSESQAERKRDYANKPKNSFVPLGYSHRYSIFTKI